MFSAVLSMVESIASVNVYGHMVFFFALGNKISWNSVAIEVHSKRTTNIHQEVINSAMLETSMTL